jgi:hypothetical protein
MKNWYLGCEIGCEKYVLFCFLKQTCPRTYLSKGKKNPNTLGNFH